MDAEHGQQHRIQRRRQGPGVEDVVFQRPEPSVTAVEPAPFQRPRRTQSTEGRAEEERVDALAQPRAGGVLRSRHAGVVPSVVLDVEVPVTGLGQRDLAEPPLGPGPLMAQFVRRVDGHPADAADRQHQTDRVHHAQAHPAAAAPQPAGQCQRQVLGGQIQIGGPPVEAILLEPRQGALRWVLGVLADEIVQQRDSDEHEQRTRPPEHSEARDRHRGPRHRHQRRYDKAQQPHVALTVAPIRHDHRLLTGGRLEVVVRPHRWPDSPP